jgi:radical SAM superfamily enzyme YgiQ (UPF0313 family)
VQDFTPTPMTLSTTMYYTGINPYTGKKVYVARSINEKRAQKEYFFWYKKPGEKHSGTKAQTTFPKASVVKGRKGFGSPPGRG